MAPDLKKIFLNIFIKTEKKKLCKKDKNLFSELQNKGLSLSLRIVISQHINALMSNQQSNAMKTTANTMTRSFYSSSMTINNLPDP